MEAKGVWWDGTQVKMIPMHSKQWQKKNIKPKKNWKNGWNDKVILRQNKSLSVITDTDYDNDPQHGCKTVHLSSNYAANVELRFSSQLPGQHHQELCYEAAVWPLLASSGSKWVLHHRWIIKFGCNVGCFCQASWVGLHCKVVRNQTAGWFTDIRQHKSEVLGRISPSQKYCYQEAKYKQLIKNTETTGLSQLCRTSHTINQMSLEHKVFTTIAQIQ